ncbi:hypothetical protein WJX77_002228 [Trebouxia sp. C0004]
MEETQAIDFAEFPLEDDFAPAADIGTDQVVGALEVVSQTADSFPLYHGLNVVGRESSNQADHQDLLDKWKGDHPGIPVHGIFLQSNSISSSHAAIYIESGGAVCFIKDLGSRNKTMLGRAGGLTVLQANGDRYSVLQGDKLRFGNVDTVISYSTVHAQADPGTHAGLAAVQDANLQASEPESIVDRSPTPEMANANPPSTPVPNTDNDVTLPWNDAPAEQQDYQPEADSNSQGAAMNNETQAVEPMFAETEQQAAASSLLPDTQVIEVPSEMPHGSKFASHQQAAILCSAARSSQDRQTATSGSPQAPTAEPTQLLGEPTQLASVTGPFTGPVSTPSGPQAGTALASAAAQAMTGAQPTQASLLPSSAGFSTGMPSLAPINDPPAAVASATSALGSEAAASAGAVDSEQGPSEKQVPIAEADVDAEEAAGRLHAEGSSGQNTVLDSVLGHDDDDSIWMPHATVPGSQGTSQEAEPAVLPPTRGQDLPLQSALLSSGNAQDHVGTTASAEAARQPSDSHQTQDSHPQAQEEVQQPAARAPEKPAGVASPARQGSRGWGPAPADQGMYTGAFAFPDSASLGTSQRELDLPVFRGSKLPSAAATQGKVSGRAAAASKTGVIKTPAESAGVPEAAAAGKKGVPAKSERKAAARVVPSAWKAKKATPVADEPVETIKTGTPPEEVTEAVADVKKPSRQLPKPIMHEPDKLSPWRVRGTPLGGGAAPSQLPDSEEVNAAMAAAGQMAAFFPATQAEPDTDADTDAVVSAPLPTSAGQAKPADAGSKGEQATAAKAAQRFSADDAAQVENMQRKKGSDAKRPAPAAATAALAGDTVLPWQVSDGPATPHTAQAQEEGGGMQQEEEIQVPRAAGRGIGKRRASVSTRASVDDEEEEAGKRKAKQGRGSAGAGARGGSRVRGRKASGQGAAAKGLSPASAADSDVTDRNVDTEKAKAVAVKSKRQRSVGRESSPAVEGSRVSKRQKAKADAQAAEAAQLQEAEKQAAEEDDPFSGAATQAAAGALEELRRSATPEDDQAAEEAAVPMLVPTRRGKRSRSAHPAAASASSEAAAVAAAAALAEGPADTAQQPGGPSASVPARPRRLSAKGKAAASRTDSADLGSARSSGGNAELATASGQSNASGGSIAAATAGAGVQPQPEAIDDAEKQQGRRQSGSRARGKSRLSRASSPVGAAVMELDSDALPVKRRTSIKRSAAKGTAVGPDPVHEMRSGTASSAAQAGAGKADASAHAQTELKSGTADKAPANTGASAPGSGSRRKSAPDKGSAAAPAASGTATGSSRRSSRGRAASHAVDAVAAPEVAAEAADHLAAAPAGRAKHSGPSSNVLPDVSASEATAADDVEEAGPSSSRVEEDAAGGGGTGHDPAKRPSGPKASKGKRRRQDMAGPQEGSPASHVKAARKATDTKQVRVLYSTTLEKSKKASMSKIVKRLGGSVEDKEGPEFTHFVTLHPTSPGQTDRGFKKSINALIALAAGRPIVSDSWIDACGRSGSFVDPVDHLLMDTTAQKKFGFDMRTSYERAQHQLLLTGLHVFFTPGMLAAESDKGTNIHNLVGHAGGVVETQLPESVSGKDAKLSTQWLLIANEKDIKREQKWSKRKVASKLPFHGRTMLIDSIMQQSLDRKHGVLFTT